MADSRAFGDYLRRLATDTSARTDFQNDPAGTMKAAGLTDAQVIAVLSQDAARIQQELGTSEDAAAIRVIVTITILVTALEEAE